MGRGTPVPAHAARRPAGDPLSRMTGSLTVSVVGESGSPGNTAAPAGGVRAAPAAGCSEGAGAVRTAELGTTSGKAS